MAEQSLENPRIVEITEALPVREQWKHEAPPAPAAATAHEAFATLQATDGAAPLIEAVPSLARPDEWRLLAYFDVEGRSGPAVEGGIGGLEFWNADLGGFTLQECLDNDTIFFAGAAWEAANGRVLCYFTLPESRRVTDCTFGIRLYGYGPDTWPADEPEQANVGFFIDGRPLGARQFQHWVDTTVHARLVHGLHRFEIRQMQGSGSFLFQSTSIWNTFIAPAGPAEP
jgi:hypothetical protein